VVVVLRVRERGQLGEAYKWESGVGVGKQKWAALF
jgi:hypothetical protein